MSEKRRRLRRTLLFVLIGIGLVLIGTTYYFLVYTEVETDIRELRAAQAETQQEIEDLQQQLLLMNKMQAEMDRLDSTPGSIGRMASYNASAEEVAMLHRALISAVDYSITFREVTRQGDQIRRSFALDFTATDYTTATGIVHRLLQNDIRCMIGDISCSNDYSRELGTETIRLSLDATFYETMVDGTPDAGLPADRTSD